MSFSQLAAAENRHHFWCSQKNFRPLLFCFLHTQKDSGGASIHRIDESFPLKPSLEVKCTKDFHVLNTEDQLQNSFTGRSQCCDWLKYLCHERKAKLRQPTGQRLSNVRMKQKKNSIGPILILYYEESLVSSNLKSNLLRFPCAHPDLYLY